MIDLFITKMEACILKSCCCTKKINNTILAIVDFKKEITYANDGE